MIKKLSIVTTMYKSSRFIEKFVEQAVSTISQIKECESFEIIMVNDGSPDDSIDVALRLKERYNEIIIVDLSRNFGHHYAIMAGLGVSAGDYVMLIDNDLEVPPSNIANFVEQLKSNKDVDVVYGVQESTRKGGVVEKLGGGLFYALFNKLSETKIPRNVLTERLMNRRYTDQLLAMGDKNLFLAGMMSWVGFKQMELSIIKGKREGQSTYSFGKRLNLCLQAITSFSSYPLKVLFNIGLIITLLGFSGAIFIIIRKLIDPTNILAGYSSLIAIIVFLSGVIIIGIGIVGLYIGNLSNQTKNRQLYIIKDIYK